LMAVEIFMPKMTDHMESGEIIHWLIEEGEQVKEGQVILEVMTDKVAAELVAEASGVLRGVRPGADEGAIIPVGTTFAFIAERDEELPDLPPLESAGATREAEAAPSAPPGPIAEPEKTVPGRVQATPVARRIAKELGIDLGLVTGTGPGGRIKEEDVHAFAQAQEVTTPEPTKAVRASPVARRVARELGVDLNRVAGTGPGGRIKEEDVRAFATSAAPAATAPLVEGEVEWIDLTPIQRLTGRRMLESAQQAPQFALASDVDMTQSLWLREALMEKVLAESGERLSITAILVKVVAAALREHPRANASFLDSRVRVHRQVNVGVAVGTEDGLVVPVITKADQKSLIEVVRELKALKGKAQEMRFTTEDLSGGTFTISNLGMYGIDRFNAIINPPQSAILAVGRVVKTPVGMPDDTVTLRPMMNLTLTIDHRAMDGVQGAKFLAEIKGRLEAPYFLL
jgi:pyruvate dehydrogenase E2 component (dihydrolipoamide acetyltransferase)